MKKILFVCVENSCRSQMAEGFARVLGHGIVEVFSAGSNASGKVNADAIKVMAEVGIDISAHRSKGFNDLPFGRFDWVVTMGCGDICPFVPGEDRQDWQIRDPKGKGLEFFREVREDIRDKVEHIIEFIRSSK
jgi:glutathione/glutaredoxin type arsenate reductase